MRDRDDHRYRGEIPLLTLGDAIAAVSAEATDEREVVPVVLHMLRRKSIRLVGEPPMPPLLEQLVEAARRDDAAEFDRLFDYCFGRVYAIAWRITRDHARTEAITARILCEAAIEDG